MEWLEFKPWSAEVTAKLEALSAGLAEPHKDAEVIPLRVRRPATPQQWAQLLPAWPRDTLWGTWVDVEN